MKKRFAFLVAFLLCVCAFCTVSCATTSKLTCFELGLSEEPDGGVFIKVETGGWIYTDHELSYACRWAYLNKYKYVIKLTSDSWSYVSGYKIDDYGHISTEWGYSGAGIFYCFTNEDEKNTYLSRRIPVYTAKDKQGYAWFSDVFSGSFTASITAACIYVLAN